MEVEALPHCFGLQVSLTEQEVWEILLPFGLALMQVSTPRDDTEPALVPAPGEETAPLTAVGFRSGSTSVYLVTEAWQG